MFRANFEHKDTNLCVKPPPSFFVNNSTGERLQAELTPTWLPSLTPEDTGQAPLSKYQSIRKRSIRFNVWKFLWWWADCHNQGSISCNQILQITNSWREKLPRRKYLDNSFWRLTFDGVLLKFVVRTSMHFKQLQQQWSLYTQSVFKLDVNNDEWTFLNLFKPS